MRRRAPRSRLGAALLLVSTAIMAAGAIAPALADWRDGGAPDPDPAPVAPAVTPTPIPGAAAPAGETSEAPPAVDRTPPSEPAPEAPTAISLGDIRDGAQPTPWYQRVLSLFGLAAMVFFGWLLSNNRRLVPWRIIAWGIGLQLVFGVFVIKTDVGRAFFEFLNGVVMRLLAFTDEGVNFLFRGYPFAFAIHVLATIIFFSSLMTVLYHLGVMQWVVKGFAWIMQRTMRTSGSETLSAAANIFVGQTEAPLVVKPFVPTMTQSELMAVMTGGFATVAGGVLAAYVGMLSDRFADIAGHLIAASVMSAPAALVIAKVMIPETESSQTAGELKLHLDRPDANVIDAAARGAGEGLQLAMNVGAMLLAFLALVAMINYLFAWPALLHNQGAWETVRTALAAAGLGLPDGCATPEGALAHQGCVEAGQVLLGHGAVDASAWTPMTLERILGWLFWPLAWLMGVPTADCSVVAELLGQKLVLNEFVAYARLSELLQGGATLSYRAVVITTYALCGFANFGSIAIQIGGIGGIAPERRHDLARIGLRAMIGGTLAAFMTATVAGMLV